MASKISERAPLASPSGINQNINNSTELNNFDIDTYQYPSDLGAEDLKHWVQFTINVRGKSLASDTLSGGGRLNKERNLSEVTRAADSANFTTEQLGSAVTNLGAVAGAVGGVAAVKVFEKLFNRKQVAGGADTRVSTAGKVVAGATGAAAAAAFVNFNDLLKPDTSFRISDAIALYVDGPPTVRYAAQYSNKDLGTIAGLAAGGISSVSSVGESSAALAMKFAELPAALGVNIPDVVGAAGKIALNPFKEVLFEAIDFRAFNFKYRFFPKSEDEARSVNDIIKLFKFHMHPDLSSNKLFFIYPSEFEIAYYFVSKENIYFHKIKPCVLESMDVSYGGEQFSTFWDGKPTEINMTLTFRETEILTKKQIRDGY
jgi:hypothetical protein